MTDRKPSRDHMPDPHAGPDVHRWQLVVLALMPFVGLFTAYVAMLGRPDVERAAIGLFMVVAGVLLFVTQLRRYRVQNPQRYRDRTP